MNIRYLWVLMAVVSVTLFLFQASIDALGNDSTTIYNYDGSIIKEYDKGGYNLEVNADNGVPDLPFQVSSEAGGSDFTDIFQSIKSWFTNTKGGMIIHGLYYAVPSLLKGIGLPPEFSFALGVLWTLLAVFSFIMFMRGVS